MAAVAAPGAITIGAVKTSSIASRVTPTMLPRIQNRELGRLQNARQVLTSFALENRLNPATSSA